MSIIANLVARFTADTSGFEAGTKRAGQSMKSMMSASLALQRTVIGLAATYLGGRGLIAATRSMVSAAMDAESADRSLASALQISGQYSVRNASLLARQAERMQDLTLYSDEQIKTQQALALTMGASVSEIDGMTEAAIGMAAAYNKDLGQAMRTVALARQGETGQLKEMGIVVDLAKSKQEQFFQVMDLGKRNFQRASEDTQTLQGAVSELADEWKTLREEIAKPLTPAIKGVMRFVQQELRGGQGGQTAWHQIQALPKDQQRSLWTAYSQWTKERGVKEDFGYLSELTAAYARSGDVQAGVAADIKATAGLGTDGAAAITPDMAAAREQILKLNDDLRTQIEIQQELAAGNTHAAETVRFKTEAEKAFVEGSAEATAAMTKYGSALEYVDNLKARAAAGDLIESMEEENEYLSLLREGREEEAEALRVVNGLRREGIDLLPEETQRIEELIEANEKLQKGYGNDIGVGISGAVSAMQDDLGGLGDLSFDVVTEGIDGMADAMTNAIFEAEDLGQAMEDLAVDIAKMVAQWAIKQAITSALGGINFGGASAKGNVFGPSGLVPFARGGVVDRPTLFPFARGTGLMGEAGPEGILPLKRTAAGELGVRAELGSSGSGQVEALLGRIVTLLGRRQQVTLNATIADGRDVVTRRQMESREGERMVMYHVGRNQ